MSGLAIVTAELDALEQIQRDLAAVATRTDAERRHDLVRLRRLLALRIVSLGQVAEPLMADRPDLHVAYRQHFSAMRAGLALHQAEWPAVRLGEADDLYRISARNARAKGRAFVVWMRGTLLDLARQT